MRLFLGLCGIVVGGEDHACIDGKEPATREDKRQHEADQQPLLSLFFRGLFRAPGGICRIVSHGRHAGSFRRL
jgi:hypothetical protein